MNSQEADISPVPRWAFKVNSTVGAVAVVLGAFGAHALKDVLQSNGNIEVWKTAVFYHLIHSILLVLISDINFLSLSNTPSTSLIIINLLALSFFAIAPAVVSALIL